MKGRFITLEGPEGGGKTSQTRLLFGQLRKEGFDVLLVREPGGTPIGDQIRAVLHDHANVGMLPNTELLLFSASRGQLVGEVIRPALERGAIVLCDRYADSTYAYQGYGLGLNVNALRVITAFATGGLVPDLTFCLDLPVAEGLRRKRMAYESGASEWNRIDARDLAFHKRVHAGYHELVKRDPARWVVIDATQTFEKVAGEIRRHVDQLLANMKG